jgi:hypothetical protein
MTITLIEVEDARQTAEPLVEENTEQVPAPDPEAIPWIREIRFAVSRFGHLAKSFLVTDTKDGLRNEIFIALYEAAKTRPHLLASRYLKKGPLDSYAIQIAKNRIKDLGTPKRGGMEWVLNETEGQQERREIKVEEIPFYDATVLLGGKPSKLINYQESGSETGDAEFTSHDTIPEGEDNLADDSLPDVGESLDAVASLAKLTSVYRQLKLEMQQTLLLAKIYLHPKHEQPALLAKFGITQRLGLTPGGWDKRWARTKLEIRRLAEQKSNLKFSKTRLEWFDAYRRITARDTLSKFRGADLLLKLDELSWKLGNVLIPEKHESCACYRCRLIEQADTIKSCNFVDDPFAGRAMTVYIGSLGTLPTNYATMKTKFVRRKDSRTRIDSHSQSSTDAFLERTYKLGDISPRDEGPRSPKRKRTENPAIKPDSPVETPYRSPWVDAKAVIQGRFKETALGRAIVYEALA